MLKMTKKCWYLGLTALLAVTPVMAAGAQEETLGEPGEATEYTVTLQSMTDEDLVYSASAVVGEEADTINAYFDSIPSDTYTVLVTYLNAAAGNTSNCATAEWINDQGEDVQSSVAASYDIQTEEIDMEVRRTYTYFCHLDDIEQTVYFYCDEDESFDSALDMWWSPVTTASGRDWYADEYTLTGTAQGHTFGICDENGVFYAQQEVSFESANLKDASIMHLTFFYDPESGDVKISVDEYPDGIDENNYMMAVVYDENGEEAASIYLPCVIHDVSDFSGVIDNLAQGNYTVDVLQYIPWVGDYYSMDEETEWEQKEDGPVRINYVDFELSIEAE